MVAEDGDPTWFSPVEWQGEGHDDYLPTAFLVVEALEAFGVFTSEGLKILAEVWGKHEFGGESDEWSFHHRDLFLELAKRLEAAGLITEHATNDHAHNLINNWQLPMYNIDFTRIQVSLEELREQEANIPHYW
jgi:LmbE family N-acetylglucosaminyl deacetylase